MAALPHLPLVKLPSGLGRPWGFRKQGLDLLLPSGHEESRKPGPALPAPSPGELELSPHQGPSIPRVPTLESWCQLRRG